MPRYRWNGRELVEVTAEAPRASGVQIIRDIEPYKSPLGTGWVTSRRERREDLKRGGCREVDPSEWKPRYINREWAAKRGLPVAED